MSTHDLPTEILLRIFSFLPPTSIFFQVQYVSKKWYKVSQFEGMWQQRHNDNFFTWYDDIDPKRTWRDRFWRCYRIHSNWNNANFKKSKLRGYSRTVRQIQVTDKHLALAYGDEVEIRDAVNHDELFTVRPDFKDVAPYLKCFYVHQNRLACSAGSGWTQIDLFDLESEGKLLGGWSSTEPHPIEAIAFNDTHLVTGSRKCIVWDLTTRKEVRVFSEQQRGVVNCLQFDETLLACSHKGRKVRIWDIRSGERIFTVQGHQHLVHCLQFDDKILVTGSKDKTLRVWDKYKNYQCSAVLRGHTESIRSLSLHGWKVVSGSKDGDVRIWDITPRSPLSDSITTNEAEDRLPPESKASGIKHRSIGRLTGSDQVFSVAASSSRLYVGTRDLVVYDFDNPVNPKNTWDKISTVFTEVKSGFQSFFLERLD